MVEVSSTRASAARGPAACFARIDEQPPRFVVHDPRLVRMAEHGNVPVVRLAAKLPLHVAEDKPRAVGSRETKGRLARSGRRAVKPARRPTLLPSLSPKTDKGAPQLPQRRNGKRGNEIAGEENELALRRVEPLYRLANIRQVIVCVCKNSDAHLEVQPKKHCHQRQIRNGPAWQSLVHPQPRVVAASCPAFLFYSRFMGAKLSRQTGPQSFGELLKRLPADRGAADDEYGAVGVVEQEDGPGGPGHRALPSRWPGEAMMIRS